MVCRRAAWSSRPRSQRFPQDHGPSEAWEESRPSSFTADGEGRVNHAGSPSEWFRELKERYRDHPASCEFKSVFSQPVIHCGLCPPAPPRCPCPEPGALSYRSYEMERYPYRGPVKLVKMVAAVKLSARQFQWSNARISTHSPQSRRTPSLQPLAVLQRDPKGSAMMSVVGAWATVWSLILREHQPPATPLPTCRPCLLSAALRAPSCGPASACRRRGHLVPPSAVRPPLPRAHSHPPLARSRALRSAPCIHRRA